MSDEAASPRPLEGIRVLAVEQFQALPFASSILARLGAEVVKVEAPGTGEPARGLQPSVTDADGRQMSGTFIRNNINKRSICIDWRNPTGRELLMQVIGHFDVFAENFRADALSRSEGSGGLAGNGADPGLSLDERQPEFLLDPAGDQAERGGVYR